MRMYLPLLRVQSRTQPPQTVRFIPTAQLHITAPSQQPLLPKVGRLSNYLNCICHLSFEYMNELILLGILLVGGLLLKKAASPASGMTDNPVQIDNIRRGVANGWYTAQLTRVNGQPAIRLSGTRTDDTQFVDVYPISENDWQTLKKEGYPVD